MMKIYFAGSIRGGRDDAVVYMEIINFLSNYGRVLTEHVGDDTLTDKGESIKDDKFIHDRDMKWLKDCDLIIAEVSNPSLGVGYEIGRAINLNKRIICLYRKKIGFRLSAMISGNDSIEIIEYQDVNSLKIYIESFLKNKSL